MFTCFDTEMAEKGLNYVILLKRDKNIIFTERSNFFSAAEFFPQLWPDYLDKNWQLHKI
jgi:hypothetical protein